MANNKRYFWLKLKEDFFEESTIQFIEEQENGVYYSNFYLKLCLKSLNSGGRLTRPVGELFIPYDVKALAKLTGVSFDIAKSAMELFEKIGLVKKLDTGELYLSQLEELVGSETNKAELMRKKRAKETIENGNNAVTMLPNCYQNVTDNGNNVTQMLPNCYQNQGENGNNVTQMLPECYQNQGENGNNVTKILDNRYIDNRYIDNIDLDNKEITTINSYKKNNISNNNSSYKKDIEIITTNNSNKKDISNKSSNYKNNIYWSNSENFEVGNTKELEEEFEKLWDKYPRKQGKKESLEFYIKARTRENNPITFEQVDIAITNYCNYIHKTNREPQYIKQGKTWFENECWDDDYTVIVKQEDKYQTNNPFLRRLMIMEEEERRLSEQERNCEDFGFV